MAPSAKPASSTTNRRHAPADSVSLNVESRTLLLVAGAGAGYASPASKFVGLYAPGFTWALSGKLVGAASSKVRSSAVRSRLEPTSLIRVTCCPWGPTSSTSMSSVQLCETSSRVTSTSRIRASWVTLIWEGYGVAAAASLIVIAAVLAWTLSVSFRYMSVSELNVVLAADAGAATAPTTPSANAIVTGGASQR